MKATLILIVFFLSLMITALAQNRGQRGSTTKDVNLDFGLEIGETRNILLDHPISHRPSQSGRATVLDYEVIHDQGIIKVKGLTDGKLRLTFPTEDGKANINLNFFVGNAKSGRKGVSSPNQKKGRASVDAFLQRLSASNPELAKNVIANINGKTGQDYKNSQNAPKQVLEEKIATILSEITGLTGTSAPKQGAAEKGLTEESLEYLDQRSEEVGLYRDTTEKLSELAKKSKDQKTEASALDPIQKMLLAKILEQEKGEEATEETVPLTMAALEQYNQQRQQNSPERKSEDEFEKIMEKLMIKSSPQSREKVAQSKSFSDSLCQCENPCKLWDMVAKYNIPGMQEIALTIAEDSKQNPQARSCAIKYLGKFPEVTVAERLGRLLDKTTSKDILEAVYSSLGEIAWDDKAHVRRKDEKLSKALEKVNTSLLVNINSLNEENRSGPLKTLGKVGVKDALVELARNTSNNNKDNRRAIAQSAAAIARPASLDILKSLYENESDHCFKQELLQLAAWTLQECKECLNDPKKKFSLNLEGEFFSEVFKTKLKINDPFVSDKINCKVD